MNVVKIHIQLYADMALLYLHKTHQQYPSPLHLLLYNYQYF